MPTVQLNHSVAVQRTARLKQMESIFDVAPAKRSKFEKTCHVPFEDHPWQIGLIVGASGSGKSTVARQLFGSDLVDQFDWHADKSLIESFPASLPMKEITGLLSSVGFSSPPSWVRPFRCLSNGEQFRVNLARALAEKPEFVAVDEFTSVVDRQVAQIGSAAVAKTIRRRGTGQFVAVGCHYDVIDWLDPDWIYEPETDRFQWRLERQRHPPIELTIRRVHPSAWQLFGHHHYLSSSLNRSAACYVAFVGDRPAAFCAVVSFPHAVRPSFREHRTVCLPDFQGVGIGTALGDFVASLYVHKKQYTTTTSHPAMIAARRRSRNWRTIRRLGMVSAPGKRGIMSGGKKGNAPTSNTSYGRCTASFEYVGPKAARELAEQFFRGPLDEVLTYVRRHPGSTTKRIYRQLGLSDSKTLTLLRQLESEGLVTRKGKGSRVDPLAWYSC